MSGHLNKQIHVFCVITYIISHSSILMEKKSGNISNSLATYVLKGGIIVGAIGFIAGFIGLAAALVVSGVLRMAAGYIIFKGAYGR